MIDIAQKPILPQTLTLIKGVIFALTQIKNLTQALTLTIIPSQAQTSTIKPLMPNFIHKCMVCVN